MLIARLRKSPRPQPQRSGSLPRRGRALKVVTVVSAALLPALASAAPWELKPDVELAGGGEVSQKVELADVNADGFVDIVFANSSGDITGNENNAQLNQLFINNGGTGFTAADVFDEPDNTYVIKAGDVDNDGDLDLVVGNTYQEPSYVLVNEGGGNFTKDASLPANQISIGDLELGDVDNDGDLDIILADWGSSQPYGDPDDQGGPIRLWLNDGLGAFEDAGAQLPAGMANLISFSFDIELIDFDNDWDLDLFISSRGFGKAQVFRNDGAGTFESIPMPSLQPGAGKNVNVAFAPMDLNGDDFLDFLTLQDGEGAGACIEVDGVQFCAKRNSVQINDGSGGFIDNAGDFWPIGVNPPRLDFDVATLDFNNSGTADVVVTGLRLAANQVNSRLLLNNGSKLSAAPAPSDAAFPVVPELGLSFGLQFADFNRDRREDVALAVRDANQPNFVLFGREDANEGVPEDTTPPRIGANHEVLPDVLFFGKDASIRARTHDYKTPSHWHDYLFDDKLDTYNFVEGKLTNTNRRLPYMEFALGLGDPEEINTLADGDPSKFMSPATWLGEYLWKTEFTVPYAGNKEDTLTWQYCAIDAAGNKICVGPFQVQLMVDPADCGDGTVQPWEQCEPGDELCNEFCESTCGNGVCDPDENGENCPEDCGENCDNDGICEIGEDQEKCPDCEGEGECGDGICEPGEGEDPMTCPEDCNGETASDSDSNTVSDSDSDGICGNNICEEGESVSCPEDCEPTEGNCGNGTCEAEAMENNMTCPEDCPGICGDGICEYMEDCPQDCNGATATAGECPDTGPGEDGQCAIDDDGCGCTAETDDARSLWASLLLFSVFGVRRFRRRDEE